MTDEHGHEWNGYKGTMCYRCQTGRNSAEAQRRCLGYVQPTYTVPAYEAPTFTPTYEAPSIDYSTPAASTSTDFGSAFGGGDTGGGGGGSDF